VRVVIRVVLVIAALMVVGVLAWQGVMAAGNPDPAAVHISPPCGFWTSGVLVFREGLGVHPGNLGCHCQHDWQ